MADPSPDVFQVLAPVVAFLACLALRILIGIALGGPGPARPGGESDAARQLRERLLGRGPEADEPPDHETLVREDQEADERFSRGCGPALVSILVVLVAIWGLQQTGLSDADPTAFAVIVMVVAVAAIGLTYRVAVALAQRGTQETLWPWRHPRVTSTSTPDAPGDVPIEIEEPDDDGPAVLRCPYCQSVINATEARLECPSCETPHHRECWQANGGCTTYGCREKA